MQGKVLGENTGPWLMMALYCGNQQLVYKGKLITSQRVNSLISLMVLILIMPSVLFRKRLDADGKIPKVASPFLKGQDERIFSSIADLEHWALVIYNIPWLDTTLQLKINQTKKFY